MAINIPTSRERTVRNSPVSAQRQSINAPADAFGAGTARATQNFGSALDRIADENLDIQGGILDKANRARALDLQNRMQQELNDFIYNPETGLLKNKGQSAVGSEAMMKTKLEEARTKYLGQPDEPQDVLDMMESSFGKISSSYENIAQRHAFGETQNYERDVLDSRIQLNREEAALDYLNEDLYKEKLAENMQSLDAKAKAEGWSSDRLSIEKRQEKSTLRGAQITSMIATDRPNNIILAKKEYELAKVRGELTFDTALKLETQLNAAVPKAAAQLEFQNLSTGGSSIVGQDAIIGNLIDNLEGGEFIASEPRGAIAKFGINSEANPDVDVANLSRKEAVEIYKKRYWNQYDINDVPEDLQFLAFDVAVNHRSDFARQVIEEMKGGNLGANDVLNARLDEYRRLVNSDPDTYKQYFDGWKGRLQTLAQINAGPGNIPSPADVQKSADKISRIHPDAGPELVKMYDARRQEIERLEKQQRDDFEDNIHQKVAQTGGDWTVLSPAERAQAAEMGIDYTKYTGQSDPDAINELDAMTTEQLFSADLTQYRDRLTFDQMNEYREKQTELQKPENKVVQDKIDQVTQYYFRSELGQDPENKNTKSKVGAMKRFIANQVAVRFENKGNVTDQDINQIAGTFFKNRVYDPAGILNRRDNVYLIEVDEIPQDMRTAIEQSLQRENKLISDNAVKERYILHLSRRGEIQRTQ